MFKKYRNILGTPGHGIHKPRICGTAAVDYLSTILLAIVLCYVTGIPLVLTTVSLLVLGTIAHALFGVETDTLKYLGIRC